MALLGAWGGIVPYAGPAFGYPLPAGTDQSAWQWTAPHWQLYLVAGLATLAGAAVLLASGGRRDRAAGGCLLGLIGGTWFILGPVFAPAFVSGFQFATGASTLMTVVTPLGYNDGTGLLIVILALTAYSLTRTPPVQVAPSQRLEADGAGQTERASVEQAATPR